MIACRSSIAAYASVTTVSGGSRSKDASWQSRTTPPVSRPDATIRRLALRLGGGPSRGDEFSARHDHQGDVAASMSNPAAVKNLTLVGQDWRTRGRNGSGAFGSDVVAVMRSLSSDC